MKKPMAHCLSLALALQGLVLRADSADHPWLYQGGNDGTLWGPRVFEDPELTVPAEWNTNAYLVTVPGQAYAGGWNMNLAAYGLVFQKGIHHLEGAYAVGAGGIRSTVATGQTLNLYNGQIRLQATQTWSGPSATTPSAHPFVIRTSHETSPKDYPGGIVAETEGLALTLSGDMVLLLRDATTDFSGSDVVVESPARLALKTHWKSTADKPVRGRLGARKLTLRGGEGIAFGEKADCGSIAAISPEQLAATIELSGGAALNATERTSIAGGVTIVATSGSGSSMTGTYELQDDATVFKAEPGATLDLSGVSLKGAGAYALAGAGTVVLPQEAIVRLDPARVAGFHGKVTWTAGIVYVDRAAELPEDIVFCTSGTAALAIRDQTGFDAAARVQGTGNLLDDKAGLLISDVPRADVTVGTGETLCVAGDGLGADGGLTLKDGATVVFCASSTVAAPCSVSGTVTLATAAHSVTGTLGGAVSQASSALRVNSPAGGLVKLTGGGDLGAFEVRSGNAEVSGGKVKGHGSIRLYAGHLTIGAEWTFVPKWVGLDLDLEQTGDATVEIVPGGCLVTGSGQSIHIGKDPRWTSRLFVNGGTLKTRVPEEFTINCRYVSASDSLVSNDGNGVFELDGGAVFANTMELKCGDRAAPGRGIFLGDCTWKTLADEISWPHRYGYGHLLRGGNTPVTVRGTVRLDMSDFKRASVLAQGRDATGRWSFGASGRVQVIGKGRELVFRDMSEIAVCLTGVDCPGNVVVSNSVTEASADIPPVSVRWTVPAEGAVCGIVAARGEGGRTGALVASYDVPPDVTFCASQTNGWWTGFSEASVSNLTFALGSAYRIGFFDDGFAPLALDGTLSLPETMDYYVSAEGHRRAAREVPVIEAAQGVAGSCAWTCRGTRLRADRASMSVADGSVRFSYSPAGLCLFVR